MKFLDHFLEKLDRFVALLEKVARFWVMIFSFAFRYQ